MTKMLKEALAVLEEPAKQSRTRSPLSDMGRVLQSIAGRKDTMLVFSAAHAPDPAANAHCQLAQREPRSKSSSASETWDGSGSGGSIIVLAA